MLMLCGEAGLLTEREPVWPAIGNVNEVKKAAGIELEPSISPINLRSDLLLAQSWSLPR